MLNQLGWISVEENIEKANLILIFKMAESEDTELNLECGFCKKPAINKKVICMHCKTTFHISCSKKNAKKCCEKQRFFNEDSEVTGKQDTPNVSSKSYSYKMENDNLKQINEELKENLEILTRKIEKLEAENSNLKAMFNNYNQPRTQDSEEESINKIVNRIKATFESNFKSLRDEICQLKTRLNKDKENKIQTKTNQDPKNVNIQKTQPVKVQNPVTPKQYSQILKTPLDKFSIPENKQSKINEHENMNTPLQATAGEISDLGNKPNAIGPFTQRSRPSRKINVGQSQGCNEKFKGASPKVWMFISRVSQDVTEEDIKTYLNTRIGDEEENIIVKELISGSNGLKCYMVAADFKHKDQFYQPSFWPQGVGYRRFDFKLYEKYKNRHTLRNGAETQHNITQPASFLGRT